MRHRIAELTAPEAAARLAAGACAVLPMGSLETHGPHMPMGDFLLAEAVCVRVAERAAARGADALVLPPVPFGGEDFFGAVPGGGLGDGGEDLTALGQEAAALHRYGDAVRRAFQQARADGRLELLNRRGDCGDRKSVV